MRKEKKFKNEFLTSQLCHVSSILEYKYGIENTPCIHTKNEIYNIYISEGYWEVNDIPLSEPFEFDVEKLIKINPEFEAHNLAKKVWSMIPKIGYR